MTKRIVSSFVLLAVMVSAEGSAQDARLVRRLDAGTAQRVEALVDSARQQFLPTEPLVQKALEGASKGASADAIVAAVRGLSQRFTELRSVLGNAGADELITAAAALQAGVQGPELKRIHDRGAERSVAGFIGLTFLVQRGVPSAGAVNIVESMLDARLGPADFLMLQRLVEQDIRSGAPVLQAARVRSEALIQGKRGSIEGGRIIRTPGVPQ